MKKVLCVGGPRIHEEVLSRRRRWRAKADRVATVDDGGVDGAAARARGRKGGGTAAVDAVAPPASYLLDLDERFGHFYTAESFHLFNMFNVHSFHNGFNGTASAKGAPTAATTTRAELVQSLSTCDCIVLDPPFGGVLEALGRTIRWLWEVAAEASESRDPRLVALRPAGEIPTFVFLPYFLGGRLMAALPSLKMMDYRVQCK